MKNTFSKISVVCRNKSISINVLRDGMSEIRKRILEIEIAIIAEDIKRSTIDRRTVSCSIVSR